MISVTYELVTYELVTSQLSICVKNMISILKQFIKKNKMCFSFIDSSNTKEIRKISSIFRRFYVSHTDDYNQ